MYLSVCLAIRRFCESIFGVCKYIGDSVVLFMFIQVAFLKILLVFMFPLLVSGPVC